MSKNIRLYYLYRALSCAHVFKPFTYFYAISRGLSVFQFMLLYTIFSSAVILLEVPTGAWADRLGRRWSMALGAVLMAFASVGYLLAHSFAVFALFEFLFAAGLTLTSGADSAFLFDMLRDAGREDDYRRLEGRASYSKHVGLAVAALVGGVLASIDLRLPYVVTGIVSLGAAASAVGMTEPTAVTRRLHQGAAAATRRLDWAALMGYMKGAVTTISKSRGLLWAILYSAMLFVVIRMSDALYQPVLKEQGFSFLAMGVVFAGLNVVASLWARNVCRITGKLTDRVVLWSLPVLLIVSYLLLDTLGPVMSILLMVAQYSVTGMYSPFTKSLINHRVEESSVRATVLSAESAVKRLAVAVVSPILGVLISMYSLRAGLYACAAVGVAGTVMVLLMRGAPKEVRMSRDISVPSSVPSPAVSLGGECQSRVSSS